MENSLTHIRIMFQDDIPDRFIAIPANRENFHSLEPDQPLQLPNGETLYLYAEVAAARSIADIMLSIIEDDRELTVRCGAGVIINYTTRARYEVLLQIGTGAWDE
ncbi:MAG: hypothetical protein REI12_02080 [Pedobacter sp.]|nr:hypothetical protein [Pedobacter sp.]